MTAAELLASFLLAAVWHGPVGTPCWTFGGAILPLELAAGVSEAESSFVFEWGGRVVP